MKVHLETLLPMSIPVCIFCFVLTAEINLLALIENYQQKHISLIILP